MPTPPAPSPYGYATGYVPNRPPPRAVATRPSVRPGGGLTPPRPPDAAAFLATLAAGVPTRTDDEWDALLGPRLQPYIDAINSSTNTARAMNEYRFETKSAANQGLGEAFLKLLTGGQTGDEAAAYAKQNFGGSYLPAQAMQIAADELRRLTSDFDDDDWEVTGQYMQAMNQIPGIRDELRAKVEASDRDDYATRVQTASLLLDESWRLYNANRDSFKFDVNAQETTRVHDAQLAQARKALGITGYEKRGDAVSEARTLSDDTGNVWQVRRGKDGSWEPYDTGKKKATTGGAKSDVGSRNAALREASDMTKGTGNLWRVRQQGGTWVAYDTGQKKAAGSGPSGLSAAQKAERDLAVAVLTEHRDAIMGAPSASGVRSKPMTYRDAYEFVYGLAEASLSPYGRKHAYLSRWTRQRLAALGLKDPAGRPRQGG